MGELVADKHARYILMAEKKKESFESVVMDHLRMNGAYWGLTTLALLDKLGSVSVDEVVYWVMTCQHESGGFAGNTGHDPHVLYTLSAVQILALFDKLDILDVGKVSSCILYHLASLLIMKMGLSQEICGRAFTMLKLQLQDCLCRFSYISICCLSKLKCLDQIKVKKVVDDIVCCKNLDGGFGCTPGEESHEYVMLFELSTRLESFMVAGRLLFLFMQFSVVWMLLLSPGVFTMLIRTYLVGGCVKDKSSLGDLENGGISDRPDDAVDIFHTYFGVAGLSLLEYSGVKEIDPAYALPVDVINRIILNK
ncbi:unnamed protein product [Eruca vesicaria subsp. sativa]|uniref:Prenyltransferase alpha-alpha toroid domain-containing protein n=1 Tax=Eruca vesicaria subsp. sativa TaxID=29727 RepID=A0ABC8J436_ERUVS|nr:unnamed protein product [Eruca vesicaria subsp. sativa]